MRCIVYGAGGIGGAIGGLLHRSGHDTVLIARGPHLDAMRRDGLRLRTPDGEAILDVTVAGHPGEVDWRNGDVVVLAMKTQDTVAALKALAAVAPPDTPVVCAQNGTFNERTALRRFANVYGVYVVMPTRHLEPGVVETSWSPVAGVVDIGRYPGGADATAEAVAATFGSAHLASVVRTDIMRWKWAKLLMNLGNSVQALCGPDGDGAGELFERAVDEGRAALAAAGIDVATDAEVGERSAEIDTVRSVRPGGGSTWQSVERGAGSVETDYLNGEIVLQGRLHDVPTPVNEALQHLMWTLVRTGGRPGSVSAAEVLAAAGVASGA